MLAELRQHPADYHYLTPLRETAAIANPSMAFATPLGRDRPLSPRTSAEMEDQMRLLVPFEPSGWEPAPEAESSYAEGSSTEEEPAASQQPNSEEESAANKAGASRREAPTCLS